MENTEILEDLLEQPGNSGKSIALKPRHALRLPTA